jgi:hypothetical protein
MFFSRLPASPALFSVTFIYEPFIFPPPQNTNRLMCTLKCVFMDFFLSFSSFKGFSVMLTNKFCGKGEKSMETTLLFMENVYHLTHD